MVRNRPIDRVTNGQLFTQYYGKISDKENIKNHAPFIEDVDKELKKQEEEAQKRAEMFVDEQQFFDTEEGAE